MKSNGSMLSCFRFLKIIKMGYTASHSIATENEVREIPILDNYSFLLEAVLILIIDIDLTIDFFVVGGSCYTVKNLVILLV